MLATHCPICGHKANVVKVVSYPYNEELDCVNQRHGLAIFTDKGEICCSFDEGQFDTREEADASALEFDADVLAAMADDKRAEAGGYYDLADSDFYEVDYPSW